MSGVTIVAPLTPPEVAALGVLGVLGPNAVEIVQSLFQQGRGGLYPYRPSYGWFGSTTRDDVVVCVVGESAEPCCEISCHGGPAMVERLIDDVAAHGAVRADWRKFERRRGRSDFQCDALQSLAFAATPRTAAILVDQLNGALDRALAAARASPEAAREVLKWQAVGRLVERPARVVLFGLPNAGKSTLFNALVGYPRVVTSADAGTTRDLVTETIALDGWPVELADGAGIREDASPLEAEGVRRLAKALEQTDLRVLVVDATLPRGTADALMERLEPHIIVANKMDLPGATLPRRNALVCAAATGQGVEGVRKAFINALVPETPPADAPVPFLTRHRQLFASLLTPSGA